MQRLKFLFLILPFFSFAQKKIIDHTVYNDWKSISNILLSNDGKYSVFRIKPLRGDGYLYIVNNLTGKRDSIARAYNPMISGKSSFVAFKITPGFDTLRKCELNKVKKDKWPKDSLGVYLFEKDTILKFPKIKSFSVAENSVWIAFLKEDNKSDQPKTKEKKKKRKKKKEPEKEIKSDGTILTYLNPMTNDLMTHNNITEVYFSKYNNISANINHQKDKVDSFAIQLTDLDKKENWQVTQKFTQISKVTFNNKGTDFAFLGSLDTVQKNKTFGLYYYAIASKNLTKLIDSVDIKLPKGKSVNEKSAVYFSENGKRLFFGVADKPKVEAKDTLLENEKAVLDVWSWTDDRLQPQQLKELKKDEAKSDLYYVDLDSMDLIMLAADSLDVELSQKGNGTFALASSNKAYLASYQWELPGREDLYRINIVTGETKLLKKGAVHQSNLAPSGAYLTYYHEKEKHLYLLDIDQNKETCVTCLEKDEWLEDVNGMSILPSLIASPSWIRPTNGNKEEKFLICSEYNVYEYDILKNSLRVVSNNGKKDQTWKYGRILKWNPDSSYFHPENNYIKAFHKLTRANTIYKFEQKNEQLFLSEKLSVDESLVSERKAKNADYYTFQKQSVLNYPDLFGTTWLTNTDIKRLSFTNLQQKDYNWSTVELISWKNYEGVPLEGLIYKPEDFEVNKKYPLMIYYYELHSDDLHNHYAPKPTASIIHPTEYASSGYVVFVPDIRYNIGHPAKGAYSAIMSGTDYVLKKYPQVDSTKMGLQGQSWGGYQTAQLITMTKRYRAAMAGAPVGNMFSAYGGIRWGTGINRQFP